MKVDVIYRGWLSMDERNQLHMSGEGDLAARLMREVARFGHHVRLRFFTAHNEIPLEPLRHLPWKGEGFVTLDDQLRAPGVNLVELLRPRIGQYVHLELEFEV